MKRIRARRNQEEEVAAKAEFVLEGEKWDRAILAEHLGVREELSAHLCSSDLIRLVLEHAGRLDFAQRVHEVRASYFADRWTDAIWHFVIGPIQGSAKLPCIGFSSLDWVAYEFAERAMLTAQEFEEFFDKVRPALLQADKHCGVTQAAIHRALHTYYCSHLGKKIIF
jgi:hypothetical protein